MFVGLTDLKVRLGVTGSGSDAPLTAALTAADAAVRACLNFSPEGWTGTEFVSGTDTPRLSLARPNVTAVYRVCVAAGWGDGGYAPGAFDAAADLTDGTDYALDGDLLVRLRGAVWPAGRRVRPGSLAAEPGGAGGNVLVRYSAELMAARLGIYELVVEALHVRDNPFAAGAAQAIFFNQGQVCTAGSRLYVHRSRFDAVVDHLAEIASGMKMGPGIDPATQIGPLVSKVQQTRVLDYVQSGFAEGARAAAGGAAGEGPGCFVRPTVLVDVHEDMRVVREEIFGPVVVAQAFDDLDDIARRANDTPYGLAASIWSNDLSRVHRLIPKIKAGTVWVNCHNIIENVMPFGGFKQSGIGREAGRAALELYTESKSVIMML
mgnify:CR=1 FL=1